MYKSIKSLSLNNDISPLLLLAIPLVLNGVVQSSLNFFGNIFLAQLGPQVMAAGALVSWFVATLVVILFGTFSAVNILIAHKYGANDIDGISHVLRDGVALALLLTPPLFVLFWNISPIFLLLGQSHALVTLASAYIHALAWGVLPQLLFIVMLEFLLGLGHTRVITAVTLLTIPFDIVCSYVLIFGKFGFPALGIEGAGWGFTIGYWLAAMVLGFYIFTQKKYRCYVVSLFRFARPFYFWEIVQLGLPMGAMYFVEVGFFFVMTLLMGLLGVHALAANQLAMQYLGPLMGSIFCIAQAVTIRMGHELGAKQKGPAERAALAGVIISGLFMCVIACLYWTKPEFFIAVDFNLQAPENTETIHFATQFLFVAAFFQILEAMRIALFGALRGLKDTRFSLLTSIISFWGIALPIGYVLSITFKFGAAGFWWGMVFGAGFSVVLLYRRFSVRMRLYQV